MPKIVLEKNYGFIKRLICTVLILISFQNVFSQDVLVGRVTIDSIASQDVSIENTTKETFTITDAKGLFKIEVTEGDVLKVSSVQIKTVFFILSKKDISSKIFDIGLFSHTNQLEEVEVTQYQDINATSLGIIPKDFVHLTPAEKELDLATNFHFSGKSGVTFTIDPIINAISGRTKRMKRNVKIEERGFTLQKIDLIYEDDYYVQKLKIPKEYIKGFHYILMDNQEFMEAFESKNRARMDFLSMDLASKYLLILKN